MADLFEEYRNARIVARGLKKPSDKDIAILNLLKKTQSVTLTAKQLGVGSSRIYGAVARASAYKA